MIVDASLVLILCYYLRLRRKPISGHQGAFMFSARFSALSLSLLVVGFATASHAEELNPHQVAVTLVAVGELCNKEDPTLKGSVENAIASDPTMDEAAKAEIRKVQADPKSKPEVDAMVVNLKTSGMWNVSKDMCKYYGAK
jgi:hypothetical protein